MQRENIGIAGTKENKLFLQRWAFIKYGFGITLYLLAVYVGEYKMHIQGAKLLPIMAIAFACLFLGAIDFAKSKGLHPAFGILAVCTIIGILVLVAWPDNYQISGSSRKSKKSK